MKYILLTRNKKATVDDDVYAFLIRHKWHARKRPGDHTFYAGATIPRFQNRTPTLLMHHLVVGYPPGGYCVDHENGNGLDNRRENLRVVPKRINQTNRERHRNGFFPGVSFSKSSKKWRAYIKLGEKQFHLGLFTTPLKAYKAYTKALKKYDPASHEYLRSQA